MFNVVDDLIEVELKGSDDFLKIKETLTRIGIPSKKEKDEWELTPKYNIGNKRRSDNGNTES